MSFRDVARWRAELDGVRRGTHEVIRQATPAVARYTRDTIRKRVPPGATTAVGMSNRFPGYAATGRLKSQIVAGPVRNSGNNGFTAHVGLAANATRLDEIKARVHEYGMVIHARNRPFMVFQIQGRWVQVRRVRIRAKRFFRSGWAEAQTRFPDILGQYVRQRWPAKRR